MKMNQIVLKLPLLFTEVQLFYLKNSGGGVTQFYTYYIVVGVWHLCTVLII